MKKFLALTLVLSFCFMLIACGATESPGSSSGSTDSTFQGEEPESADTEDTQDIDLSPEEVIDSALRNIVNEKYSSTDISSISINENSGTEAEGDYIALVYLVWNVQNKPDTTKQMLAMYSEDFAARVGADISNVSEFTVFWTVPYYSETDTAVKFSYVRVDGGMSETESLISNILD